MLLAHSQASPQTAIDKVSLHPDSQLEMKTQDPEKTEYNGHIYDSRNEAIFARVNDLMQERNAASFPYQSRPRLLNFAGHRWDLCIDKFTPVMAEIMGTRNYYEYQLDRPAESFIRKISQPAITWAKQERERGDQLVAVYFNLVWGDPLQLVARGETYQVMCLASNFADLDPTDLSPRDFGEPELLSQAVEYDFNSSF